MAKEKNLTTPRDAARRDLFISGLKSCFRPPYDVSNRVLAQNVPNGTYGHVRVTSLNLFLRHVITSVDVVKGLEEAISNTSL